MQFVYLKPYWGIYHCQSRRNIMITLAQLPPSVQVTTMTEINPTMEAWNLIFESQADIEVEEAFDRGISFRDFESFFSYEFTYRTEFMNNPGVSRLTH